MQRRKNEQKKNVTVEFKYDYPLPNAVELEKDVLGCMLIDNTVVGALSDYFKADSFFDQRNQEIFNIIFDFFKKGIIVDEPILRKEIEVRGLQNQVTYEYISALTNITTINQYGQYSTIIEDQAIKRRAIKASLETLQKLFSNTDSALDIIRETVQLMDQCHTGFADYKDITPGTVGKELYEQIYKNMQAESYVSGIPTGIPQLDIKFGGWQKTHLACIGARTRHGKTAIAIGFMFNASSVPVDPLHPISSPYFESKHKVGFFSMEMKATEIMVRLLTMELHRMGFDFKYAELVKGNIDPADMPTVQEALARISRRGIYIDDTPGLDVMRIKSKSMAMKDKFGVELIFIDYLQQMQTLQFDKNYGNNVAVNTAQNMQALKTVAKKIDIAVTVLSQMDRGVEKVGTPRMGNIAELKNSGGIEEACDEIMLLFRPEVYYTGGGFDSEEDERGIMKINLAKNKQGETGIVDVPFNVMQNTFTDMEYGTLEYNKYLSKEGRVRNGWLDKIDHDNRWRQLNNDDDDDRPF